MSNNAVTVFDPNSSALPAHIAAAAGELGSNIADGLRVPSVGYEGKVWSITLHGNKVRLETPNQDGDMAPVPVLRAVILNYNPTRGRSYYEGAYDPSKATAPKCWSPDGAKPDASVVEKQSTTCTDCPMAVKGSKITEQQKEVAACSQHRMLALVPAMQLDHEPLRIKIAATSDWDKDLQEHGWFAWRQYTDYLKSRGIVNTALVVTKMKFDSSVAYPKILFGVDRYLEPSEIDFLRPILDSKKVTDLLNESWSAQGQDGVKNADDGNAGINPDPAAVGAPAPSQVPPTSVVIEGEIVGGGTLPYNPIEAAEADGWVKHPENPDYHYKGTEVVLSKDLLGRYPAPVSVAAPAPPSPPPIAPSAPVQDPLEAARADGWTIHPENPAYHFKGTEVVANEALAERYPSASGATPAAPVTSPSAATDAAQASASSGTTAANGASPSDATAIPADVKNILAGWTT